MAANWIDDRVYIDHVAANGVAMANRADDHVHGPAANIPHRRRRDDALRPETANADKLHPSIHSIQFSGMINQDIYYI